MASDLDTAARVAEYNNWYAVVVRRMAERRPLVERDLIWAHLASAVITGDRNIETVFADDLVARARMASATEKAAFAVELSSWDDAVSRDARQSDANPFDVYPD